jgi:hypothetical protein
MKDNQAEWFIENIPTEILESSLCRFKVGIVDDNDKSKHLHQIDVPTYVEIDADNIEKHLRETPAQYAFLSVIYAEAKKQLSVIERSIKIRRSQIFKECYEKGGSEKVRLTVEQIKAIVELDEEVSRLEELGFNAESRVSKLFGLLKTVELKNNNIAQLAKIKVQERFNT